MQICLVSMKFEGFHGFPGIDGSHGIPRAANEKNQRRPRSHQRSRARSAMEATKKRRRRRCGARMINHACSVWSKLQHAPVSIKVGGLTKRAHVDHLRSSRNAATTTMKPAWKMSSRSCRSCRSRAASQKPSHRPRREAKRKRLRRRSERLHEGNLSKLASVAFGLVESRLLCRSRNR